MEGDLKRNETVSPMAGKTPSQEMLVDVTRLEREYFERLRDVEYPTQLVSLGTSGHRDSSLRGSFNEAHGRSMTPRRRLVQFSFLLQPNKSLFTKLVNLRVLDTARLRNRRYLNRFRLAPTLRKTSNDSRDVERFGVSVAIASRSLRWKRF